MHDDRILKLLREKSGLSDREITNQLFGPGQAQQTTNQVCRRLERSGLIERRKRHDGRIGNYFSNSERSKATMARKAGLRVFLCHASGDKPAVKKLYERLEGDGFSPWLDEFELLPGQDWEREIRLGVRACHVVVVCLSRRSVTKEGFVQREIKFALDVAEEKPETAIFIIPVRLQEVDVPERLRKWQWADVFREDGYKKLVRALKIRQAFCKPANEEQPGGVEISRNSLIVQRAEYCKIDFDRAQGVFARLGHGISSASYFSILLHICNLATTEIPAVPLGTVRAQITFKFDDQHYPFSPAMWLGEPTNIVNFGPGDTRHLILAIGTNFTQDWYGVVNRRGGINDPVGVDLSQEIPAMIGKAAIEINLISTASGAMLLTFFLDWEWDWGRNQPHIKNFRKLE
jgi:DNA-binding MarR family transcriptional regulator